MRAIAASAIASLIGLVMAASPAASLSSIGLEWRGAGGATEVFVSGTASVELIADITLTVDAGASNVLFIGISVRVDEDDANELDIVSINEINEVNLAGMGNFFAPLSAGTSTVDGAGSHLIEGFDQASQPGQPGAAAGTTVTLGSIKFSTNNANLNGSPTEGADVRIFVQLNGIDVIADTSGNRCIGELALNDCPYDFGELKVNAPEPTTSTLIVLGLGIGAFYSRRH